MYIIRAIKAFLDASSHFLLLLEETPWTTTAAHGNIVALPLPVILQLAGTTVSLHIDSIQRLIKSRGISILHRRREKKKSSRPFTRIGGFPLTIFSSLFLDRFLDVVDLFLLVGSATFDGASGVESETRLAVARRVIDIVIALS